jgi:hypothetical protein
MLHHLLSEICEEEFSDLLDGKPRVYYDGLELKFADGSTLLVRYFSGDEYSFHWIREKEDFRIDTAPLHKGLDTFPNHLHDSTGEVKKDGVTDPKDAPEENLRRVIGLVVEKLRNSVTPSSENKHSGQEGKDDPRRKGRDEDR